MPGIVAGSKFMCWSGRSVSACVISAPAANWNRNSTLAGTRLGFITEKVVVKKSLVRPFREVAGVPCRATPTKCACPSSVNPMNVRDGGMKTWPDATGVTV